MSQQHYGRAFGGNAPENYERFFVPAIGAPVAADLIDIAALRPGERVLDVACGTGVVARLAAERVGTTGTVAGLDINPGMLVVARSVAPSGVAIEWHEASAPCRCPMRHLTSLPVRWDCSLCRTNAPHFGRCGVSLLPVVA